MLPSRVWYRFDPDHEERGYREAQQAIDARLAELLSPYEGRTEGVLPWLYGRIRNMLGSGSSFWKQLAPTAPDEFQEETLPPDESRPVEAPEGISEELTQVWERALDPFEFVASHRGKGLDEIEYQILMRMSEGQSSSQIGAALQLPASTVRDRLRSLRARLGIR